MSWLSLIDYSYRHRISLSTIRRRIKAQGIEHKKESGKYFLKEDFLPGGSSDSNQNLDTHLDQTSDISLVLQELKKAYGMVLAEKEELITHLKEEISTQKKIIEFLENEINFESQRAQHSQNNMDSANSFNLNQNLDLKNFE